MKNESQNYCRGQAVIIITIFFLFASLIIIFGASSIALKESKIVNNLAFSQKSYFLSEAGIEDVIFRIKNNKQISSEETIELNEGWASTTVSDTLEGDKEINVLGDVSRNIRKIEAILTTSTGIDFFYGAQVGEGGIVMEENSKIEGTGGSAGNVYSNGPIIGASGATITGDAVVATGISEDQQAKSIVCSSPPDGDQIVGKNNPEIDFAQSFKPSSSLMLAKISLYIKKVDSPTDRDVFITVDSSGSPAKNYLAKGKLYSVLVGTNYAWIDVTFPNPPLLTEGQTYWIVLDAKQDSNKYWVWCKDKDQGYGNGIAEFSKDWQGDPWTDIIGDLNFKIYLGSGVSSIEKMSVLRTAKANTIKDSSIGKDAYYQTIINSTVGGTLYPNSSDPPVLNMPISQANIDQWKTDAGAGGIINGNCGDSGTAECIIGDDKMLSLGPKKINGNLVLTKKQTLNVTGTLYFTGYISIDSSSGAKVKCDPSFGKRNCLILTDSWVHIENNAIFQGSGEPGSYIMILTNLSGCTGGAQQPQCTHHNGAIDIHNKAIGAIFYSSHSLVHLHNGVEITEVTAYKLELENNAIVRYEQGLIHTLFSSGPSGGYSIDNWIEVP